MAQAKRPVRAIGSTAEDAARRRAQHRMDKGLSQQELAELVGTSHSQISRIESGRHRTNFDSLLRIAHALDLKVVVGFESVTKGGRARRDLVTL
ncbi:MAG: helix-turn-helix domain-containing protein [Acidimicrobiia bacterium]